MLSRLRHPLFAPLMTWPVLLVNLMGPEDVRHKRKLVLEIFRAENVMASPEAKECFDEETAVLWFAARQLTRERTLGDFTGRNEWMKIVVKLTRAGEGMPAREAAVDEESQKAMMSYYFKKQEEMKRIAEDEDISYGSSVWADPRALRRHFQGIEDVRSR